MVRDGSANNAGHRYRSRMRRAALIVGVVGLLVIGGWVLVPKGDQGSDRLAASSPTALILRTPTNVGGTPVPRVVITGIGDSLMLQVMPALETAIQATPPSALLVRIDAVAGRQFSAGIKLAQQYRTHGLLGGIVVVELGTNGPIAHGDFDRMMSALSEVSRVVIVNTHSPRPWEQEVNTTLAAGVARYKNAALVDWHSFGEAHPEAFDADAVHLTSQGAHEYAQLIASAIGTGGS